MALELYFIYENKKRYRNGITHPRIYARRFYFNENAQNIRVSPLRGPCKGCEKCNKNQNLWQITYDVVVRTKLDKKPWIRQERKTLCVPKGAYNVRMDSKKPIITRKNYYE